MERVFLAIPRFNRGRLPIRSREFATCAAVADVAAVVVNSVVGFGGVVDDDDVAVEVVFEGDPQEMTPIRTIPTAADAARIRFTRQTLLAAAFLGELIQALRDGEIMFSKMWTRRHSMAPLVISAALTAAACTTNQPAQQHNSDTALPLRTVGEIALPGDNSRFDYASLDSQRGLLFIAHLGASEVIEVDVHSGQVVRTIPNVARVHGVLVVPALNRVYATATGANQVVAINETTSAEVGRAPTGQYPDGLAYDSRRNAIWTTNESGGTETVVDAATMQPRGTVDLGGEVGNVGYDTDSDRMLVALQGRNELAVIDPEAVTVVRRVALPGCNHPHGLSIDGPDRLVFVACDQNATLVTADQTNWNIVGTNPVGDDPDVLAYDSAGHRLYVAAESGTLTTLDLHDHSLAVSGSGHLADGAHVVAVDITTHRSYYPVPSGTNGHPALLEREPS